MDFSVIPAHFKFILPFLAASFAISFAVFPFYIKKLKEMQWGQQIREEGPKDHLSKKGTSCRLRCGCCRKTPGPSPSS